MTLNELQRIKQWHVAHRADHPVEYHLWDAMLTLWVMGWVGFLAVVPWIQALGWAFKPTTVIDVRYLPEERRTETEATIAKLTGNSPLAITTPATQQGESAP